MGKLRVVPIVKEPGFIKLELDEELGIGDSESCAEPGQKEPSNISIKTREGTVIRVGREMPLKQVARLIKMLEIRRPHGMG